ncbi:MAG: hypothetical protein EP335_01415 [Alphaproteobacteria bacterium]|nr:MAG: hypothetical protein EP335_01415 [Alphaproteobacteria bacterium]
MILQRFMKHIKDQNWFAVGVDVIVVVVGVFLGVYIGDVATERALQHDVYDAVEVVEAQIREDLANLDQVIAYRQEKLKAPQTVIAELDKETFDPALLSENLGLSVRRLYTFFPNESGYSGLKDRGLLAKIDDPALRLALANLFDRVYYRHQVIATESDRYAFDYDMNFALVYWDFSKQTFIGDPVVARARLNNAFHKLRGSSDWYLFFTTETLRPAIQATLDAIADYKARMHP